MAPRKKAAKRTARKGPARKKAAKRTTKKAAKRTAKKRTAKKTARRTTKKAAKRRTATRKPAVAASASRPKSVKFATRRAGVFTQLDLQDQLQAWNPELSKKQVRTIVEDTLGTLQTAVKKTGKVRLKGIGTISTKKIPARKGGKMVTNPFTGEKVKQKPKPASVKVKIAAAKELKQR